MNYNYENDVFNMIVLNCIYVINDILIIEVCDNEKYVYF